MPEEIAIIIVISILAGTFSGILRMILNYKKARMGITGGTRSDASMTTSELERLLFKVVEEATEPLMQRIDDLELLLEKQTQEAPRLNKASTDLMADVDAMKPMEPMPAPRRRSRS